MGRVERIQSAIASGGQKSASISLPSVSRDIPVCILEGVPRQWPESNHFARQVSGQAESVAEGSQDNVA